MPENEFERDYDVHLIEDCHLGEQVPPGLPLYQSPEPEVPYHLIGRPDKLHIPQVTLNMQETLDFKQSHNNWQVIKDVVGLLKYFKDGTVETYPDKLVREAHRGKDESAMYGIAHIGGQDVVMYAMNWDFFLGSLGLAAGETFQAAADLAVHKKLPFVSLYASAGVRQQENTLGLTQMLRMVHAIGHYKDKVQQPHIAVLVGEVWGGVSASGVPNADVVVALAGTNFGFAGPKVIEAFEGKPVPVGMQSAETNLVDRNIDVIVPDEYALVDFLSSFVQTAKLPDKHHELDSASEPVIRNITAHGEGRAFNFDGEGIGFPDLDTHLRNGTTIILNNKPQATLDEQATDEEKEEFLAANFQDLIGDANRVDTEFLLQFAFTDAVPLYNYVYESEILRYPAVIGALAKIGTQPFVVIGNQPSYRKLGNVVRKIPASPGPKDFEYASRMLELGERLHLPTVMITDTLGAEPTIDNERIGLSRSIAKLLDKGMRYKYPLICVVAGALGSGGGLATTPRGDYGLMLDRALAFVAEPRSAASIVYSTESPDNDQTRKTLATISPRAEDQLAHGVIDRVIPEAPDPYVTAENVHKFVLEAFKSLPDANWRLHRARDKRIRGLNGHEVLQQTAGEEAF